MFFQDHGTELLEHLKLKPAEVKIYKRLCREYGMSVCRAGLEADLYEIRQTYFTGSSIAQTFFESGKSFYEYKERKTKMLQELVAARETEEEGELLSSAGTSSPALKARKLSASGAAASAQKMPKKAAEPEQQVLRKKPWSWLPEGGKKQREVEEERRLQRAFADAQALDTVAEEASLCWDPAARLWGFATESIKEELARIQEVKANRAWAGAGGVMDDYRR